MRPSTSNLPYIMVRDQAIHRPWCRFPLCIVLFTNDAVIWTWRKREALVTTAGGWCRLECAGYPGLWRAGQRPRQQRKPTRGPGHSPSVCKSRAASCLTSISDRRAWRPLVAAPGRAGASRIAALGGADLGAGGAGSLLLLGLGPHGILSPGCTGGQRQTGVFRLTGIS